MLARGGGFCYNRDKRNERGKSVPQEDMKQAPEQTTLCYLEKDGAYLMLHRNKRGESDMNNGLWMGVGGHFETGEDAEACMKREVWEETALTPTAYRKRGEILFESDRYPSEVMHLFVVTDWTGELGECSEGELAWIDKAQVPLLPAWEGDRYFLAELAQDTPYFTMKLTYCGSTLTKVEKNGTPIPFQK